MRTNRSRTEASGAIPKQRAQAVGSKRVGPGRPVRQRVSNMNKEVISEVNIRIFF